MIADVLFALAVAFLVAGYDMRRAPSINWATLRLAMIFGGGAFVLVEVMHVYIRFLLAVV